MVYAWNASAYFTARLKNPQVPASVSAHLSWRPSLLRHIPMHNLHAVPGFVQTLAYFFGDHHGTVLAAGAAETDRQIALALANVVRQKVNQQIGDAPDELFGLRKRPDVPGNSRIAPSKLAKFRHEMRVGKKTNVEYQIRFFRQTVAKPEAHAGNQNALSRGLFAKALGDVRA